MRVMKFVEADRRAIWAAVAIGVFGPLTAVLVTWLPALDVANVRPPGVPSQEVVESLRAFPADDVLLELKEIAVSYPRFDNTDNQRVLSDAEKLLDGQYTLDGVDEPVRVPFAEQDLLSGSSTAHLWLHGFEVPSLLGRAYEISGEIKYLNSAIQYAIDWGDYEDSLLLPQGLFYNDHAIAARAIVVTELWRLYRQSGVYQPNQAAKLLDYVQYLATLLLDARLYEYRSNHGIMQCLSLMHLATAFPLLEVANRSFETGLERINSQLPFFINSEGVILEHSASYHINGLRRLAAAWRYMGLNEVAVSEDMASRYRKALHFAAVLSRPDGTLPPIGDTHMRSSSPLNIVEFDQANAVKAPLRPVTSGEMRPLTDTIIVEGAGYIVQWRGLQYWPDSRGLSQTVFYWSNFPTQVHKHADDMGIAIWAHGTQWLRGIGYWPYIRSRPEVTGWRSANAPHWLHESKDVKRSSKLNSYATGPDLSFYDAVRTNVDGREVRRAVALVGDDTWIVVDGFSADGTGQLEILWRFSPELLIRQLSPANFLISADNANMNMLVDSVQPLVIEMDGYGEEDWNAGLVSDHGIVPSPAIRVQADESNQAIATVFRLQTEVGAPALADAVDLAWRGPTDWTVTIADAASRDVALRRVENTVSVSVERLPTSEIELLDGNSVSAQEAARDAVEAYEQMHHRYGEPFHLRFDTRTRVSGVILTLAFFQVLACAVVFARFNKWRGPLLAASLLGWLALPLWIELSVLA